MAMRSLVRGARSVRRRQPLGPLRLLDVSWRAAVIATLITVTVILLVLLTNNFGAPFLFDFKGDLYNAGQAIIHGRNPYRASFLDTLASIQRAGGTSPTTFAVPVYAAPALLASVPLSLLPFWLAGGVFTMLSIGALILGLRLLGVRDWRCFTLALISWPFLLGVYFGNLGPLLLLGAAIAWRWRDSLWPPALAIASIVLAKVFPWPLAVWLLVTRRFRVLALTALITVVGLFAAWAVIGFDGMAEYPRMLANLSFVEEGKSTSLVALLMGTGVPAGLARIAALAVTAALLGTAWRLAHRPDGDRRALGLAVIAALTGSPIVWEHYLVLLFIPIALISPTLSAIWFVPVLTGLVPTPNPHSLPQMLVWVGLEALVVARVCWTRPAGALVTRPDRQRRGGEQHEPDLPAVSRLDRGEPEHGGEHPETVESWAAYRQRDEEEHEIVRP